jgi:hypothetical protein
MTDEKRPIGRPTLYGTPASETIRVRITPAQRLELRRVATAHGTDLSGVIRELIDERVEDGRAFPDRRRRLEDDETPD